MSKQDFASLIFHPSTEKSVYAFTNPEVYYEYQSNKGLIECTLTYINRTYNTKTNYVNIFNLFSVDLNKDDEIIVDIKIKPYDYGKAYRASFIVNGYELLDMKAGQYPQDNFNIIFNHNMNVFYEKIPS